MRRNTYLLTALLSTGLMACHNEPAFKVGPYSTLETV